MVQNELARYLYEVAQTDAWKFTKESDLLDELKKQNCTEPDFYLALKFLEEKKYIQSKMGKYQITGEGMEFVQREVIHAIPNYGREAIQRQDISNDLQGRSTNYALYGWITGIISIVIVILLTFVPYLLKKPTAQINPTVASESSGKLAKVVFDNVDPYVWFVKSYESILTFTQEEIIKESGDDFERENSYYRIYRHPNDCQSNDMRGVLVHVIFFKSDAGSRAYFTNAFADIKNTSPVITNSVGETSYFREYNQPDEHCGNKISDMYSLLFQRNNAIGIVKAWSVPNSVDYKSVQEWLNRIATELDTTFRENSN